MEPDMAELVVALDFNNALDALNMAGVLRGHAPWVKVGLELFISEGPRIIHSLKGLGFKVFLDLKLHDIPNTVRGAALAAAASGADMMTLHLCGGERMCRAAAEAVAGLSRPPLLMGVTVLTSLAEGELPGCAVPLEMFAKTLARGASEWGMHGVVCSGHEVADIKRACPGLLCLTPGIRLAGGEGDDQRRVMTPAQAVRNGSDFLVVGRPVTRAANPAAAADAVRADMTSVQTPER